MLNLAKVGDGLVGLGCLLASGGALLLQHYIPGGGGMMSAIYLGEPMLSHVTVAFAKERLTYWITYRNYIFLPLGLLGLMALRWRDPRLAFGLGICLPWLALSLLALSDQAGSLNKYYSFPIMVGLWRPVVCAAVLQEADRPRRYLTLQIAISAMSMALTVFGKGNSDLAPWTHFGFEWREYLAQTETGMDWLLNHRREFGRMAVDDATASIRLGAFSRDEVRFLLSFSDEEAARIDTWIYLPGSFLDDVRRSLMKRAGLMDGQPIPDTRLMMSIRLPRAPIPP